MKINLLKRLLKNTTASLIAVFLCSNAYPADIYINSNGVTANGAAIGYYNNSSSWTVARGATNTMLWTNTTTGWTNNFASGTNAPYMNGIRWESSSTNGLLISGTSNNTGVLIGLNPFIDVTSSTGLIKLGQGTLAGSNGLTKKGAGQLNFQSSFNTFTGGLTIEAGRVNFGTSNNIPTSNNLDLKGGELNFGAANLNLTFANVRWGDGKLTGGTGSSLTASSYIISNNVAITNSYVLAGSGGLLKSGEAALILNATNTYTGNTIVNTGTLIVNNILYSPNIMINTGGTLGGSGSLQEVVLNGGTISAGNSTGLLSMTSLNASNGQFVFEIGAPTTRGLTYDAINTQSLLTVGANTTWAFTTYNNYVFQLNDRYDLFDWGSIETIGFNETVLQAALPSLASTPDLLWNVSEFTTSGVVSIIPEPTTLEFLSLPFKTIKFLAVVLQENHKGNYMYAIPNNNL
jgi:autotransporter-associated beta strand protein